MKLQYASEVSAIQDYIQVEVRILEVEQLCRLWKCHSPFDTISCIFVHPFGFLHGKQVLPVRGLALYSPYRIFLEKDAIHLDSAAYERVGRGALRASSKRKTSREPVKIRGRKFLDIIRKEISGDVHRVVV